MLFSCFYFFDFYFIVCATKYLWPQENGVFSSIAFKVWAIIVIVIVIHNTPPSLPEVLQALSRS